MKFLSLLALAGAASAVALPGDDWKTWQSCPKTTQMVTVTAIPQKQIEYKTQYETKYETKYDTKYETKYGMLASRSHLFANYTYFYQKLRLLRSLSHNTRQSTRRSRSRSRSTRQSTRQSRSQLRNMSPKLSTRLVCWSHSKCWPTLMTLLRISNQDRTEERLHHPSSSEAVCHERGVCYQGMRQARMGQVGCI